MVPYIACKKSKHHSHKQKTTNHSIEAGTTRFSFICYKRDFFFIYETVWTIAVITEMHLKVIVNTSSF